MIWVALIVLWHYSLLNDGITISLSTSHYAWTYGPTVIITVIASLWRQVDYHCKIAQPWKEMNYSPVNASKGLLLDYISPVQIITFYRAFRNYHWGTALSVLTFTLLKVVILLSTVLLVRVPTPNSCILPLVITSKFNGSNFWSAVPGYYSDRPGEVATFNERTPAYLWDAPELISAYIGIISYQVEEPSGLQGGIAFQNLDVPPVADNLTQISATVNAFIPNITCEASVLSLGDYTHPGSRSIALDSPTCSVGHFADTLSVWTCDENCSSYDETWSIIRVNCSEAADTVKLLKEPTNILIDEYTPHDLRFAVIAVNFTNTEVKNSDNNDTAIPSSWISTSNQTGAIICKFDYSIQNVTSIMDIATSLIQIRVPGHLTSPPQRLNLTGIELGELLFSLVTHDWRLSHLIRTLPDELAYDAEVMANMTTRIFSGLAAQLIHQEWTVADNTSINGTGVCYENRLHIQPVTLWGMVSIFILMSLLPLLIVFSMTGAVVPVNPSSVAALATILANSPSLQPLLARAGSLRTSELKKWLDGYIFKSMFDAEGRFQLVVTGSPPFYHKSRAAQLSGNRLDLSPEDIKVKKGNWVPLAARYPFLSLTFGLPILAIIALEALYRVSQHNHGLAQADYTALPYIQYATSAVILVIATTFNSVDFTIQSCSPFHALLTRRKVAGQGIVDNFLDKIPFVALYQAARNKYFGAALSNIATMIGSTLTIVSSGLWVVQSTIPIIASVETSSSTTWDLRWNNSATDDGGASALLSSIDANETISPEGVWGDLVFPDLGVINFLDETRMSRFNSADSAESFHFVFTLPALRPSLSCETVPEENIYLSVSYGNNIVYGNNQPVTIIGINSVVNLPKGCNGGPSDDRQYLWLNDSLSIVHLSLRDRSSKDFLDFGKEYGSKIEQPDNPNGCPSIVVNFAYLAINDLSTKNVTVLLCSQKIQEVQAEVSLRANKTGRVGERSLLSPPLTNKSTATYLTNSTDGAYSFNYYIKKNFYGLTRFTGTAIEATLDYFFNHVVFGLNRTPLEDMTGPNNVDKLKDSVNHLYKRYIVQVINTPIFRKPLNHSHPVTQQSFNRTANALVSRLTVDFTSKLVLQIMLAAMLVLEAVSLSQIKLRGLLPRSPCSIASVMALLAGGTICYSNFTLQKGKLMS
ncbi:hypothetical protein F4679DRAFT_587934 [Xylaria curta]|nr:hypothetical protein F4679DRAFT_587934 [Xylaria curta]